MLANLAFLVLADPRLTDAQVASQKEAGQRLYLVMEETLAEAARRLKATTPTTAGDLADFAGKAFAAEGLLAEEPVVVAVNGEGADPARTATVRDTPIRPGDLLLIDLTARRDGPESVYADLTWTAFAGRRDDLPPRAARAWGAVREGRDAVLALFQDSLSQGRPLPGDRLDEAARLPVVKAGLGGYFPHPAGHSLGTKPFGDGPNLLAGETRPIGNGECVAVEPGVYFPGEMGIRTELDVCVSEGRAVVTTGNPQRQIRCLLE